MHRVIGITWNHQLPIKVCNDIALRLQPLRILQLSLKYLRALSRSDKRIIAFEKQQRVTKLDGLHRALTRPVLRHSIHPRWISSRFSRDIYEGQWCAYDGISFVREHDALSPEHSNSDRSLHTRRKRLSSGKG